VPGVEDLRLDGLDVHSDVANAVHGFARAHDRPVIACRLSPFAISWSSRLVPWIEGPGHSRDILVIRSTPDAEAVGTSLRDARRLVDVTSLQKPARIRRHWGRGSRKSDRSMPRGKTCSHTLTVRARDGAVARARTVMIRVGSESCQGASLTSQHEMNECR